MLAVELHQVHSISKTSCGDLPVPDRLRALELRSGGFRMVSCPSCGRVQIDLNRVANEIEQGHVRGEQELKAKQL